MQPASPVPVGSGASWSCAATLQRQRDWWALPLLPPCWPGAKRPLGTLCEGFAQEHCRYAMSLNQPWKHVMPAWKCLQLETPTTDYFCTPMACARHTTNTSLLSLCVLLPPPVCPACACNAARLLCMCTVARGLTVTLQHWQRRPPPWLLQPLLLTPTPLPWLHATPCTPLRPKCASRSWWRGTALAGRAGSAVCSGAAAAGAASPTVVRMDPVGLVVGPLVGATAARTPY